MRTICKRYWVHALTLAFLVSTSWAVTGCSVNPATGERQLTLLTEAQEIQMGQEADQQISASLGLVDDQGLQSYVDSLGKKLAASSERPELPWSFKVVDDPIVNAFALPGGYIYVTRGMLAHMNSEAELMGVLGHEIGHVTARHSVEQLSRGQLASLGLGVAMIASEEFRQFGDLAQTGLGLLFLKFGRDDERQSDDLGLRYLVNTGYDPNEMPKTFETLERVSAAQGAGRIPDFLSTHPNPGRRVERLQKQVSEMPAEARQGTVDRAEYLGQLDGLHYGPNPREGFFKDNVFYHPEMAFQLTFPSGWKFSNQKQAVLAMSPNQDAQVILTLAQDQGSAEQAAQSFFERNKALQRGQAWRNGFYHFRTDPNAAAQGAQNLRGIVGFVPHQGRVFLMAGLTPLQRWNNQENAIAQSLASFAKLTDRRYLNVKPRTLDVVKLPRAMSLEEFSRRYTTSADLQTLSLLNGVDASHTFQAGDRVKRVMGELP